ncbi:PHD finger protein ALFIN-LIKE 2-like [Papaver somniferum]|uniref:PHD finger protein ALFIN-LIKE 2-like n=1 Tax=Papaver somniferum TaxID=3469 RepID=UPI000E6FBA80|nr:PHD finger protein ALFIN-LIKE 2-like [Papaver somniferum]
MCKLDFVLCFSFLSDVDEFYALCDPEKENLCLYGHANESWEVTLPAEEVPPELPESALGINFARDGMNRRDWLSLVAVHSDSWLLSVAFYLGARFNRNERFDLLASRTFTSRRSGYIYKWKTRSYTCCDQVFYLFV